MIIVFRVDASLTIGTGHVMRCLTLADALRVHGAHCIFVCRPHEGHLIHLIRQRCHEALALPASPEDSKIKMSEQSYTHWLGVDWLVDAQDTSDLLSTLIEGGTAEWFVLDHYALDVRWEDQLRKKARYILVIDDLADRMHRCDLLLDQNLGRKEDDYISLLQSSTKTMIGPEYALIRPEFAALRRQCLERRNKQPGLRRLLIAMGGVDKDNTTGLVLEAISKCEVPVDLEITVVLGPHAPWISQVQLQAAQMHNRTELMIGVSNMAEIISNSDLAIGAAGGTAWERCTLGLPSFIMVQARNQMQGAIALQEAGAALIFETPAQLIGLLNMVLRERRGNDILAGMSAAAARITNGLGAARVAETMIKYNDV